MNRFLLALLVPIVALLGWVASLELKLISDQQVRLKVQGYDPRDLLSGHFVRYTLSLDNFIPCATPRATPSCVCLTTDGAPYHEPTWAGSCDERPPDCALFIRGNCRGLRFETGLERYSIPEKFAPVLQTVPPDSSIIVALSSNGSAQVIQFLVGEEPVEKYAEAKLRERATVVPK